MEWKVPLFKIYWDEEDVNRVVQSIRRGMYWAIGPNIEEFEKGICRYIGTNYAVVFNSGTSALHATMVAHGIKPGDEVIVPSFTFIATANAPLFVGAKPVFVDIEEKTCGIDPEDVKRKITEKTKAMIPIHFAGCPCFIQELREIACEHDLILIEDVAQAFGAKIGEKKVGTFGDSAIFSFCAPKIITTGEGGVVVTDSKEIYENLKLVRSHGRAETADYFSSAEYMDYVSLGYNFRMSDMIAALGVAQLAKVDAIIKMRRDNAHYMNKRLSKIDGIITPHPPPNYFHVYQIYTIRIKEGKGLRDALIQHLTENGIMTKTYEQPVHLSRFYRDKFGYKGGELPITEKLAGEVLTLPMYPHLTREEMDYILKKISEFFSRKVQ